jgi:hypothetical protein
MWNVDIVALCITLYIRLILRGKTIFFSHHIIIVIHVCTVMTESKNEVNDNRPKRIAAADLNEWLSNRLLTKLTHTKYYSSREKRWEY